MRSGAQPPRRGAPRSHGRAAPRRRRRGAGGGRGRRMRRTAGRRRRRRRGGWSGACGEPAPRSPAASCSPAPSAPPPWASSASRWAPSSRASPSAWAPPPAPSTRGCCWPPASRCSPLRCSAVARPTRRPWRRLRHRPQRRHRPLLWPPPGTRTRPAAAPAGRRRRPCRRGRWRRRRPGGGRTSCFWGCWCSCWACWAPSPAPSSTATPCRWWRGSTRTIACCSPAAGPARGADPRPPTAPPRRSAARSCGTTSKAWCSPPFSTRWSASWACLTCFLSRTTRPRSSADGGGGGGERPQRRRRRAGGGGGGGAAALGGGRRATARAPSSPAASPRSAPGIAPSRPSPISTWASSTSSTRPAWRCTVADIPPSSCPATRLWTPSSTPLIPTATLCPASSPPPTRRSTPGSPALTALNARRRRRDARHLVRPPDRRDGRERARQRFAAAALGDSSRTTDGMVPPSRAQRDTGGVPPCLWLCGSFSSLPPCSPLPSSPSLPHTDPSSAGGWIFRRLRKKRLRVGSSRRLSSVAKFSSLQVIHQSPALAVQSYPFMITSQCKEKVSWSFFTSQKS